MRRDVLDGDDEGAAPCACGGRGPRRTRWSSLLLAFVAGIGVWHAVGFWSFLTSLVHGLEPPAISLVAAVVERVRPHEWANMIARVERGPSDAAAVGKCITLARPLTGLEAVSLGCPPRDSDLRIANGVAVRDHRLATSLPLLATFGPAAQAPVAGWVARVADPAAFVDPTSTTEAGSPARQ